MSSLRYAVRSLLKSPGYTAIALITLALGIGVNTSMFSTVDALLFRSAPYPESDRLVMLAGMTRDGEQRNFSEPEIREIRPQVTGFSSLTTAEYVSQALAEPGRPAERLTGAAFSREMIDTLRVHPSLGRNFTAEEFEPGKNQVILISERFWKARYGGDRNVIGHTLRLDGETVTIVGVIPERFDYPMLWGPISFWRPLNFTRDQLLHRGYRNLLLIGRLQPGVTSAAIVNQLAPLARAQEKAFPQDYPGFRYRAMPLHEATMDDLGRSLSWMLLGLSGFVLLICCANLANLQLARATASVREFAIRAALGASRARLVAQQLTECLLLSITGGALGFGVALEIDDLLERSLLIGGEARFSIPIDSRVLLVTLLVSLLTGVLFGIVPALFASRPDVTQALKAQARGATASRGQHRLRHALIVGEVALALVLLGGAAIMNRGFSQLLQRRVGWDTDRVLTASLPLPENHYDTDAKRTAFFRRLESRLVALPGVEHAALATSLPLFNYTSDRQVFIDAPASGQAQNPVASHVMIAGDYFATLGIPLLAGRTFAPDLTADSPPFIIVNEALARHFWPGRSAVGRRLGVIENVQGSNVTIWREVIGVVGDVEPAANVANPPTRLTVYRPLVQEPWAYVNLVVRAAPGLGRVEGLADSVRRAVAEVDPDLPADNLGSVRQFVSRMQHNLIVVGQMLLGFAALGLALAAIGLYGVISHLVAQRTTEFGIRLALGAQPKDVLASVLNRGLRLALIGCAIGLAGAYGLGRFLAAIMPRLARADPLALALVAVLLFAVTLIACWFPARRATKVDPMVALRAE
jgi:predicted permease